MFCQLGIYLQLESDKLWRMLTNHRALAHGLIRNLTCTKHVHTHQFAMLCNAQRLLFWTLCLGRCGILLEISPSQPEYKSCCTDEANQMPDTRTGPEVVEKVDSQRDLFTGHHWTISLPVSWQVMCRICLRSAIAISPHVARRWRGCRARWRSWSWHEKNKSNGARKCKRTSSQTSDNIQTVLAAQLAVNMHKATKRLWWLVLGCEHVNPPKDFYNSTRRGLKHHINQKIARVDYPNLDPDGPQQTIPSVQDKYRNHQKPFQLEIASDFQKKITALTDNCPNCPLSHDWPVPTCIIHPSSSSRSCSWL